MYEPAVLLQCFTIRISSSAEFGSDRTFPLFVTLDS